ncbi:O-acyltransferase WSD1-like [Chenopodium quinoa]|uniref:Diacylglycerol O-acyltransferase n=1 Tax=Chenopodium quinoa TaxID=63459 RepID=A0A803L770_CHEQI|nr:O-acyltransferase WSD1-like [Chenopodium quinoa]
MKSKLQIKTERGNLQENDGFEPVSPTGQYFNSKKLSVCILAVLESEVPVDDSCAIPQLRDVFLPINPRFSSIMVTDKNGVKQWKKLEVNLQDHLIIPSFPEDLSVESYDEYFDEYLTKTSSDLLPQNRPLWEVHIFKYPTSKAAGHIIFKLHHALGDGYSLMGALLSCVKRADNPSLPLTFPTTRSSLTNKSNSTRIIDWVPQTISAIFKGAYDFGWSFLKSTYNPDDKTPIRSGKSQGFQPTKISTIELSLDHIKLIKARVGTTINDILAGIAFHGIRVYMQEIDPESNISQSTALVLLNTRNITRYTSVKEMKTAHTKMWGNQFAFLHVAIPELIDDNSSNPLDFVYKTQQQIARLRNSPAVYLTAQCLEIARKCKGPEAAAELIYNTMNKSSMGMTNMIGPIEKVALVDHPVKGIYFMVCGTPKSLVITIMSYMQTVRIGVGVEKGLIDSQKLTSCIKNAFDLVYEAASKSQ